MFSFNGLWLLKYAGRPTPKMMKRWSRKTATDVNNNPTNQRRTLRERENHSNHELRSRLIHRINVHNPLGFNEYQVVVRLILNCYLVEGWLDID